jgi:filamentous hemagglutinin family protein
MLSARQARRLRTKSAGRKGDLRNMQHSSPAAFKAIPRNLLLATVSGLALFVAVPGTSAKPLGGGSSAPPAATAPAVAPQAGQAALQAQAAMKRSLEAIQAMQAAQRAARDAAKAAAANIPNGLRPGGLQVAPGAVPGSNLWQGADAPTQVVRGVQTEVTVKQNQQKAILTWESFNVGRDTSLTFDQRGGNGADGSNSWVALNRVLDPSMAPSQILGSIKAEGQIYVINQNGVIFGGSSQINVGALTASALNITDAVFKGTLADTRWDQGEIPVFYNSSGLAGDVKVERGAQIVAKSGGRVLLLGQNVSNSGEIQADDGQVALIAGRTVVMRASSTSELRGFEFEINGSNGGLALNDGLITARHGNISLVGLNVEQRGVAMTTTSVTANGSITLHARDSFAFDYQSNRSEYSRTGSVIIGEGSLTSILPELEDTATIAATELANRSTVDIVGRTIQFQRNSLVQATGGSISALAVRDSMTPGSNPGTRIFVEEGAWLDVSGSVGVDVRTEDNIIAVNLRGNELKDSPLQRDGFLYGKTIYVDMRESGYFTDDLMKDVEWFAGEPGKWYGTPLADMSGYMGTIRRGVGELTAAAGTITLQTSGDLVTKAGSLLTASGGSLNYQPGYVTTTRLVAANGTLVALNKADPTQEYVGIAGQFTRENARWGVSQTWTSPLTSGHRFEAGYTQGKAGGTINLTAPQMQLNGAVKAEAGVNSANRGSATLGGALVLGNDSTNVNRAMRVGDVRFQAQTPVTGAVPDFADSTPLPTSELVLSTEMLTEGGFGRLEVYSDGLIHVAADAHLGLPEGGAVVLAGANVNVDGKITTHGGTIRLSTLGRAAYPTLDPSLPRDITIGSGAVLDVSGLWVNDRVNPDAATPQAIHGGTIELLAPGYAAYSGETPNIDVGIVTVEEGSFLNARGGGHLSFKGDLTAGNGGSIALRGKELHIDGAYTGDALGAGGTLSLTARNIQVGGTASAGTLLIDPDLFKSGFGKYALNGYDSFVVAPGTVVKAERPTFMLPDSFDLPTGSSLAMTSMWMPEGQRQAVDLSFSSFRPTYSIGNTVSQNNATGSLDIGSGASITVDAGASIALSAGRLVTIDGTITAHGGRIDVSLGASQMSAADAGRSIWLKAGSLLDVSGATVLDYNRLGLRVGTVLGGGIVSVNDNARGAIVTEAGSRIDVSGASGVLDLAPHDLPGHARGIVPTTVYSDAGSIRFAALNGMSLNGGYRAEGGGASSRRGSLTLVSGNVLQSQVNAGIIEVLADAPAAPSGTPGSALAFGNRAQVSAAALSESGFDDITLQAGSQVTLEGGTRLEARRGIAIDAPTVSVRAGAAGTDAMVQAGNVSFGNFNEEKQTQPGAPTAGAGVLKIKTNLLDIVGTISLLDIGRSVFDVAGDVRLSGRYQSIYDPATSISTPTLIGMFATAGDLDITAAQLYPTVLSDYTLSSTTSITIRSSGGPTPVPLSAGGKLTLAAPTILQAGVVRAPLGTIKFDSGANGTVTLAPGSLTSVSAEGALIPMGRVRNGETWYFGDVVADVNRLIDLTMPPEKRIEINGQQIDMQAGSRLDVSGGGDVTAFEWVPGTGGSRDILSSKPGAPVFAVVPGYSGGAAPVDPVASRNTDLKVGDSVYLADVPGLAAGWYTLLPGQYALLPGGFRVTLATAPADAVPTFSTHRPDGSYIVAGRFGVPGIGVEDSRTSFLRVMSGEVVRKFSEYREYTGTEFAARGRCRAGYSERHAGLAARWCDEFRRGQGRPRRPPRYRRGIHRDHRRGRGARGGLCPEPAWRHALASGRREPSRGRPA